MLYGSSFNVLTFSLINIQFAFPGKNRFCGHKRIWDREAIRKQINSRGEKWKCIPCLCLHKLGKEKEKWNRIITDVKKSNLGHSSQPQEHLLMIQVLAPDLTCFRMIIWNTATGLSLLFTKTPKCTPGIKRAIRLACVQCQWPTSSRYIM